MDNNLDKSLSNDSDDHFNNGQLSSSNGNYLNDNNYLRNKSNRQNLNFIDSCKNLAIAYIVLWTIMLVFYIVITPFFNSYHYVTGYYYDYYGHYYYSHSYYAIDYDRWNACFTASVCVGGIIGFVLFILGIFLMEKTVHLKSFYSNYINKGLFVWFWIGLVMAGLPSFIGSVLTIVSCNNVKRQCFNDFASSNNNESSKETVNKHDSLSVDASKWLSVLYIVLFLSLILLIIIFGTLTLSINDTDTAFTYNIEYNVINFSTVSGSILWILLSALSIVLAIQTMSLYKSYIHCTKGLFIWFVLGIFLILPSFIGSIITIVKCDWIRNQYFDDWNFIRNNKMNGNYDANNQYNLNNNYWNAQSSHNNYVMSLLTNLSISYIVTWVTLVAFMIGAACCFNYFNACVISGTSYWASQYAGFVACMIFVLLLSIVLLVLGVCLISKTKELKNYYSGMDLYNLLFSFGLIFFGFTSVVASFMTMSACNKIKLQGSVTYGQ